MEAERAINHHQPSISLFVGVAGGLKDVEIGDVVAATSIHYYETGKAELEFRPRPDGGETSYPLQQRARALARDPDGRWRRRILGPPNATPPRVVVAPIAAGEKVVASERAGIREFL